MRPFPAIVLAGSRPTGDPLARGAGTASKALVPVGGRPMLDRVVRTLIDHPLVSQVIVLAQQGEALAAHPQCAWMRGDPRIRFNPGGAGPSQSLLCALDDAPTTLPLLVTTADNVLLTAAMIDTFVAGAASAGAGAATGADLAVAMVERRVLIAAYPRSRRTWLKFRRGWWSGANLFWIGSADARRVVALWRGVEQDRKRGWRVVATFGPVLLAAAALRLVTIGRAVTLAGRKLGIVARVVPMPQPEACIDADTAADIALIEAILAARELAPDVTLHQT